MNFIDHLRKTLTGWNAGKLALALAGFASCVVLTDLPTGTEHWSADLQTAHFSERKPTQYSHIAVVEITETTLETLPYVSPLDRGLLADLITAIDNAKPKAIGIDIVFDRATEPVKDERLIEALKAAQSPIVIGALDKTTMLPKESAFQSDFIARSGGKAGHVYLDTRYRNPTVISDHVVREIAEPLTGEGAIPSLAQALADSVFDVDDSHIAWLLPPRDGSSTFLTLPAEAVLGKVVPLEPLLKGKIVLIGGNYPDRDQHLTPLSVESGRRIAGVFIHAHILRQYLDKATLRSLPWYALAALFVGAFIAGFVRGFCLPKKPGYPIFAEMITALGLLLAVFIAFAGFDTLVPFLSLWLAIAAAALVGDLWRDFVREQA